LMPMVIEVMTEARTDFAALELIAVTIGPGSFTGLRTGLAAARGLARARSLPLVGVTTTEAVALAAYRQLADSDLGRPITVVLNSRRDDLYVQRFSAELVPTEGPLAATPQKILDAVPEGSVVFAGDATGQIMDIVQSWPETPEFSYVPISGPNAVYVAEIAAGRWSDSTVKKALVPDKLLYLRAPDASQPVNQGRVRQ
jgi:tRNA threonylcarbamoyladenosine biosynthesis protein TsaB